VSSVPVPAEPEPPSKPRLRGRLHQAAFFAAIPPGIVLLAVAPTTPTRIAAVVYWLTLLAQFGVSATYHVGSWEGRALAWFQRLDHSSIFLLIAGTYTPMCLLVLHGRALWITLLLIWAGATVGIATKLYRVDMHVVSGIMYGGMGWAALVVLPAIARQLSTVGLALVIVGGVIYSLGALVLARNKPDPFPGTFGYHELWHAATIAGAGCMYAAILLGFLAS